MENILKFGVSGCVGLILGLVLAQFIGGLTTNGTLFLVGLSVILCVAIGQIASWLYTKRTDAPEPPSKGESDPASD